jgi:hypothetical protein
MHHLAALAVEKDRDDIASRTAELTPDLVAPGRHEDQWVVCGQLDQRLGEHDDQRKGTTAVSRFIPGGGADGGDRTLRNQHVSHAILANRDEVGADGDDEAAGGVATDAAHSHGSPSFPEIEEHSGNGRFLAGLAFEPPLASPTGRGSVDATLREPTRESRERVVVGEVERLLRR